MTDVRAQQRTTEGAQWVYLKISLKENVPYSIRPEGKTIVIDFNISSIEAKLSAHNQKDAVRSRESLAGVGSNEDNEMKKPARHETIKRYTDRIISVDFQDADIKSVLRLMAEYGNMSIISGDDVKGNVTLTMKNVPWEQALDSILDVKGLAKKQMGDVISVMTLERKKKDESDKKAAEEDQIKAEDARKARELQILVEKGKLRQILIEAKIVEVSEEFVRNLGVQWGFGNQQRVGTSYGLGLSGGSNPLTQTNAQSMTYPSQIPCDKSRNHRSINDGSSQFPIQCARAHFWSCFWRRARLY
ncbi:MAG: secretin and TonB N-terminal domain-containing protein [Desulfobacterales bacterium]|nr:secretin and TonB N-terminal domain-containing protein [Desulfobacterales bacterium]